jgi:hypothetical protein
MQEKFNDKAGDGLLQVGTNFLARLAKTPLVAIEKGSDCFNVDFGSGENIRCDDDEVRRLRAGIGRFNEAGGRFFWLQDDLAVNLDLISSVSAMRRGLWIGYPGGTWKTQPVDDAQAVFERYLKEAEGVEPGASEFLKTPATPSHGGLKL